MSSRALCCRAPLSGDWQGTIEQQETGSIEWLDSEGALTRSLNHGTYDIAVKRFYVGQRLADFLICEVDGFEAEYILSPKECKSIYSYITGDETRIALIAGPDSVEIEVVQNCDEINKDFDLPPAYMFIPSIPPELYAEADRLVAKAKASNYQALIQVGRPLKGDDFVFA